MRIGRYQVTEVIGAGGFATVYRATDERLGVDVAVKVLAENHSLDPDVRERFIEEGRRLRRAQNPHLVSVHDLDETDRAQPYLVLEWADRGDLAGRVAALRKQGWRPGRDDVLALAGSLAEAVHILHTHHLVHRDLAPTNLLLASTPSGSGPGSVRSGGHGEGQNGLIHGDERLLLADLGLSKDLAAASGLTVAGGTSGFAPPEQREPGRTIDHRADVWAASAIAAWLVLDHPPDDRGEWQKELRAAGWPATFVSALARGLAVSPKDRYPDIIVWLAAVEDSLPPPPPPTATQPDDRRRRRAALGLAVGTIVVLGLVAMLVLPADSKIKTKELSGGEERITLAEHGVKVELQGLPKVEVDQEMVWTVTVEGTDSWVWVGPDGTVQQGARNFEVATDAAGEGTLRLLAFSADGEEVEVSRDLEVTR